MRRSLVLVGLAGVALTLCGLLIRDERSASERSATAESEAVHPERATLATSDTRIDEVGPGLSRTAVSATRDELAHEVLHVFGKVLVEDGGALGAGVELQVDVYRGIFSAPAAALVPVAVDGAFEFPVPSRTTHVMLELRAQELFTPVEVRAVPGEEALVVAQRRTQATRIREGWTIAGRVLDEDGVPFVGARVSAVPAPDPGGAVFQSDAFQSVKAEAVSDVDGRFELTGLELVHVRVRATSSEALAGVDIDVTAENGDVHDLVLEMARGGCIRGTVRWQDGLPVLDFQCGARTKSGGRSASFSNGSFELCGLAPGQEWSVHAFAEEKGRSGSGEVHEIRTDGLPVEIVLVEHGPPFEVEVHVRDEHGAPIEGFRVWANTSDGRLRNIGAGSSSEGRAVMSGVTAGQWEFTVRAPGFETSNRSVELAPESPPLAFVLARSARIRGIVRGTDGKLVAGASVVASRTLDDGGARVHMRRSNGSSDDQGRFELELPSGSGQILAYGVDGSVSAPLDYEIASGQTLEGFVLTLE